MQLSRVLSVALLASNLLAIPTQAVGLEGGRFDTGLGSWSAPFGGFIDWAPGADVDSCANSGAAEPTPFPSGFDETSAVLASPCFEVTPQDLKGRYSFRLTNPQASQSVSAEVELVPYADANCDPGSQLFGDSTQVVIMDYDASWTTLSFAFTVPEGALAVELRVRVRVYYHFDPVIYFDDVYLSDRSVVFEDDFEVAATCRWTAAP